MRWKPLYPLDWDFSECPDFEERILYCYEFSRESQALRERVAFIRYGTLPEPTYWAPSSDFGWAEWPAQRYLSVAQTERVRRLGILAVTKERHASLFPRETTERTAGRKRTGRASDAARYHDRLRALSVARLRVNHGAAETLQILERIDGRKVYSDTTALERAKRKVHQFLVEFVWRAETQIEHGRWFPPFGIHLIQPWNRH
jgi:hypothetical protein